MSTEVEENEELTIYEQELLELGAKAEIILQGLRYAVVFQDLDIVRKCVIDLGDCVASMDAMIEDNFGNE
tara:strand:- start:107 stop:316 length:210 start_codon:yes stop_codon:yes gene_type:complete